LPSTGWKEFYENYLGVELGKPNTDGWVNFNCNLPWHLDSDRHAAVNLYSGNYRCVNEKCREQMRKEVGRDRVEIISPTEFLVLSQNLDGWDAQRVVSEFALTLNGSSKEDQKLETGFRVLSRQEVERLSDAQLALDDDQALVRDYCESRGIRSETLREAGAGYLEDYGGHEYICLPYFAGGQLVAVRLRSWHGTRKRFIKNSCQALFLGDTLLDADSRTAIICEGETDTLVLRQVISDAGFSHIPVIGSPGVDFRYEWSRHFQEYTRVIVVPQSDRASQQTFLHNLRGVFGARLEVVTLPWPANVYGGNDISDFVRACPNGIDAFVQLLGLSAEDSERRPYAYTLETLRQEAQTEARWIIPNLIERGTKTLIVGEPKSYKTWIAINLIHSACTATSFMGNASWKPMETFSACLIEEEGPSYRIGQRFSKVFGTDHTDSLWVIHRQGVKLDDQESFSKLRQELLRLQPDIILFDPYASIHTQDENTVQGAIVVQDALNEILRAIPSTAIVVLHHTPKGGDGPRGSGALWGAGDVMLRVSKLDPGRVLLRIDERDLPDETEGGLEFIMDNATGRFSPSEQFTISPQAKIVFAVESSTGAISQVKEYLEERDDWATIEDVMSACNLTRNPARKHLLALQREHFIVVRGTGLKGQPREYKIDNE
jgi:hypothetical protein